MSDEDATRMLVTCPKQVMHVRLVEFAERTNRQHYPTADCCLTNQVSVWQAEWGSRPTRATSS